MSLATTDAPLGRPYWSVMIPTYRPQEELLRRALGSVLVQDQGPARMQIAVVDDCTPDSDVRAMVARVAGARVQFRQTERNLGLSGCWNTCIADAHGTWIHLFHQDDLVYPGFYSTLEALTQSFPQAGAAFTRHCSIDETDARKYLSPAECEQPAILPEWQKRLTAWQRLRCPAVVVRRDTYEEVGVFRSDHPFCLDWEMWGRIAASYPFAYSPEILAAHREHSHSETVRLSSTAFTILDLVSTFALLRQRLPPENHAAVTKEFAGELETYAAPLIPRLYAQGRFADFRLFYESTAGLGFSRAFRRRLRQWSWKIKLKSLGGILWPQEAEHRQ